MIVRSEGQLWGMEVAADVKKIHIIDLPMILGEGEPVPPTKLMIWQGGEVVLRVFVKFWAD